LPAVRFSKRDPDLAAVGALLLDAERKVDELLGEKQEGIAEQVDLPSCGGHEV
jgi:hypothetical protein